MLTIERAREVLRYEPDTGKMFWRISLLHTKIIPGDEAGCIDSANRVIVTVDGVPYKLHRLAWFIRNGVWPIEIDHRDRDSLNNRWSNLREVSHMVNSQNLGVFSTNKSGYNAVSLMPSGRWRARPKIMGKRVSLGTFPTKEEAAKAIEDYKNG